MSQYESNQDAIELVNYINSLGNSLSSKDFDAVYQFLGTIEVWGDKNLNRMTPQGQLPLTRAALIQGEGGTELVACFQ